MKYEVWFRVSKCKPFVFILTNAFKTLYREKIFVCNVYNCIYCFYQCDFTLISTLLYNLLIF